MDSDQALFVHDTRRIVSVNAAGCELFRCEALALVDLDMMELIADADFRGLARLRMQMLRERGHIRDVALPFRRCDGSVFWANVTSQLLSDGLFETEVDYKFEA